MISVVMATYNGGKYIEQQLDSIKNQTRKPDEVIICDDCSTDETVLIIKEYINQNKLQNWIVIENENNLGYYNNFFKAIKICKGDTIYLSDQDDVWDLRKIEIFEQFYENEPNASMIQSNVKFIDNNGNMIKSSYKYHSITESNGIVGLSTFDICKFAGSGYTMSFRKCVKEEIFSRKLNEHKNIYLYHDILIGLVATALGKCYLNLDIVDKHRLHDNNVTQLNGKLYISNRTLDNQLSILDRRRHEFDLVLKSVTDQDTLECFRMFSKFANCRYDLIKNRNLENLKFLLTHIKFYSSKYGLITDVLYSIGAEKILSLIYKVIEKL